ncbi:MAG: hypothetical protein ACP5IC_00195 [Minisyncoccia bacterium]
MSRLINKIKQNKFYIFIVAIIILIVLFIFGVGYLFGYSKNQSPIIIQKNELQ